MTVSIDTSVVFNDGDYCEVSGAKLDERSKTICKLLDQINPWPKMPECNCPDCNDKGHK